MKRAVSVRAALLLLLAIWLAAVHPAPGQEVRARLDEINAPLQEEVRRIARELNGRADARGLDAVTRAIVDLPYAALRRYGRAARLPSWLEADVRDSARALLERI